MRVLYPDILKHLLKLIAEVAPVPSLSVTPANSTVQLSGNYTLVMADAGPVGTDESQGQTRHWLVNGVTLTGAYTLHSNKSCILIINQAPTL